MSLLLTVASACDQEAARIHPPTTSPGGAPARMQPLPSEAAKVCRRFELLADRCPSVVPATDTRYRARELDFGTDAFDVVEFFANAPYPGIGRRNAPPRFAHIILKAGDLGDAFAFDWPSPTQGVVGDATEPGRESAILLDTPSWSGSRGDLVLAPPYPGGGVDADHLIYRWSEGEREYAVSLHAWKPFETAIATLHAVVGSAAG